MGTNDFPCKSSNIYDKNINFLFGSGASASYIPTLHVRNGKTYEDLLTDPDVKKDDDFINFILHSYYTNIIEKTFCTPKRPFPQNYTDTIKSYSDFLEELVLLLEKKGSTQIRRANIFTTNYDLFFENAADNILQKKTFNFNDGALGFKKRKLSISNFHLTTWHQGTHDMYKHELPSINLIKMHGSVSWKRNESEEITINYPSTSPDVIELECEKTISEFAEAVFETGEGLKRFLNLSEDDSDDLKNFVSFYKSLAIVNPTKEKFSETVFQQHYYQSLRLLSYELEKPQTVLICFGFSFQDEHILEIIKRSLSNPTLRVFVFCYSNASKAQISTLVNDSRISFIYPKNDGHNINFDKFIDRVFRNDNGDWISWTN
ncbi:SIR2 family protein [Pantoea sp. X85]|uniref:SIR2 family protein n=1 Tax=Pantoea sp. X85 TaxID=3037258 RepID=UPI0024134485|nr:SIR2 family protein [Pantoea sp. X85]WFL66601.1 SIR2 family protein [Pantoea sp. X85]